MRPSTHTALAATLLTLAACGGGEPETEDLPQPDEAAPPVQAAAPAAPPDTTAAAVWSHLQGEAYRANWTLWPGTAPLYAGTEPHGMLLTTWVNDLARDALASGGAGSLPPGSIVVKENFMPDSTFAAATVMYKVRGYNPEHQDWWFAKYDPSGVPETSGRAAMCQGCHQAADEGYLFTAVPPGP